MHPVEKTTKLLPIEIIDTLHNSVYIHEITNLKPNTSAHGRTKWWNWLSVVWSFWSVYSSPLCYSLHLLIQTQLVGVYNSYLEEY